MRVFRPIKRLGRTLAVGVALALLPVVILGATPSPVLPPTNSPRPSSFIAGSPSASPLALPQITPVPPLGTLSVAFVSFPNQATLGVGGVYRASVSNTGATSISNLVPSSIGCLNFGYTSGDFNGNGKLDPGETWFYACSLTYANVGPFSVNLIITARTIDGGVLQRGAQSLTIVINPHPSATPAGALPLGGGPTSTLPWQAILLAAFGTLAAIVAIALSRGSAVLVIGFLGDKLNRLLGLLRSRFGRRRKFSSKSFMTPEQWIRENKKH